MLDYEALDQCLQTYENPEEAKRYWYGQDLTQYAKNDPQVIYDMARALEGLHGPKPADHKKPTRKKEPEPLPEPTTFDPNEPTYLTLRSLLKDLYPEMAEQVNITNIKLRGPSTQNPGFLGATFVFGDITQQANPDPQENQLRTESD